MKRVRTSLRVVAVAMAFSTGASLSPAGASEAPPLPEPIVVESGVIDRSPSSRTVDGAMIEVPAFTITPCQEFTDSIVRLYSAYFLRAPDAGGFDFWVTELFNGRWSLPRMSQFFSESPEFQQRYGSLTDAQFIDLIYQNIFGRPADAGGRDFWLGRMANEGLDRGTVMLNFSESPEYVALSATIDPLAGYFNWYPEGTEFFCGFETLLDYGFPQLPVSVDTAIYNWGDRPIIMTYEVLTNGNWEAYFQSTLQPGEYLITFAQPVVDETIGGFRISSDGEFNYIIAYSPVPLPTTRVGWDA